VLHETGQGRQHIDWGIDVLLVHVLIDVDLTLGNVTSKIGDRMSDIIVGHGKDGNLSDRTIPALDSTGSLIDGRQIGVHVTGVTSSTGHFLSGRRDLSEGVSIRSHISENGKDVHLFLIGKMLSGREGKSRSNNTLNGGIVGVVHEKAHTVHGAVDLEVLLEETSSLKVDTHSGEDNSEVLLVMIVDILSLDKGGLTTDLSTNLGVRKTGSREERNLLASSNRGHSVDSGNTRLDHLSGVLSHVRVDRLTLDIEELLSEHRRTLVDGETGTIEGSTEHLNTHWHAHDITGELDGSTNIVDISSALENLDDSLLALNLEDLALSLGAIAEADIDDLSVLRELDVVKDDEGTLDIEDGTVVNARSNVVFGSNRFIEVFHGGLF